MLDINIVSLILILLLRVQYRAMRLLKLELLDGRLVLLLRLLLLIGVANCIWLVFVGQCFVTLLILLLLLLLL